MQNSLSTPAWSFQFVVALPLDHNILRERFETVAI